MSPSGVTGKHCSDPGAFKLDTGIVAKCYTVGALLWLSPTPPPPTPPLLWIWPELITAKTMHQQGDRISTVSLGSRWWLDKTNLHGFYPFVFIWYPVDCLLLFFFICPDLSIYLFYFFFNLVTASKNNFLIPSIKELRTKATFIYITGREEYSFIKQRGWKGEMQG